MSRQRKILIIEDQKRERDALSRVLRMEGYLPTAVSGIQELSDHFCASFDLAICDLRLGMESGLDALKVIRENWHGIPVIMVTAYGAIDSAVNAIKSGAIDYLTKPLKPEELLTLLNRYLPMGSRDSLTSTGVASLEKQLGSSSKMLDIYSSLSSLAEQDCPVLITGEQGSGHELIASAIHEQSPRNLGPFIEVRSSASGTNASELELFGQNRSDYFRRNKASKGKIALANTGTLFIEEFFSTSIDLQSRIWNSIGAKVATDKLPEIDVRLIAGSGLTLADLREYTQVNACVLGAMENYLIEIPPLREHREDVPVLIDYFLAECSRRHLRSVPVLEETLLRFFRDYEWPGNIRQLRNTIENMLVLSRRDQISMDDFSAFLGGDQLIESTSASATDVSLSELERIAVIGALKRCLGNKTHAAQRLGISVRTLQRKMKQWKLDGSEVDA